jgi:disulfide oxidoreductase YuzD
VNVDDEDSAQRLGAVLGEVREAGLLFPVTIIDGEAVYDGAVSYPAILRQVTSRLGESA